MAPYFDVTSKISLRCYPLKFLFNYSRPFKCTEVNYGKGRFHSS